MFSRLCARLSGWYIIVGTNIMQFAKKHPYIASQIVIYSLAFVGTILGLLLHKG